MNTDHFLYENTYESWRLHKTSIAQVSRKCLRGKLRHFLKEIHVIEKSIFKKTWSSQWNKLESSFFRSHGYSSELHFHRLVVIFHTKSLQQCNDETMNFLQGKLPSRTHGSARSKRTDCGKLCFVSLLLIKPSLWFEHIRVVEEARIAVVDQVRGI